MYKTVSGDMFDYIAYKNYGDCLYTQKLMRDNRTLLKNFVFNSGTEINITTIENPNLNNLPPWKRD